ncbi:hypothetical protein PhaeoP75_02004 [Phaeobacter gallaeciensis]|uniref:Uncharacterized protein n=1 Tax=Phaeobacter gallaeciensis TaxID=60890 RepID=A0AAC9Z9B4_9RHOB|nr:hypothetical protein Gal_01963 [Phaeobacter gallaeciensis DSM 26640]ATE92979.1 hypothetical protein PhaeoP11_01954 [Phaeobacter gallaeciensis]ATE97199.1 hypothetical protein PhaeoP73_01892 [Phaeobacter gallaeciensis]ATF01644.1 hypothetical protein PhaeoP75_02004 [Phaeobacter gallaeciensis]ATF06024.1 hypothetical protein PhaeoP63_01952 [Phaeobacter gallaeciensis]
MREHTAAATLWVCGGFLVWFVDYGYDDSRARMSGPSAPRSILAGQQWSGLSADRLGAGLFLMGLHRLIGGIQRQQDRGVAVLELPRGDQYLKPVEGRIRDQAILR